MLIKEATEITGGLGFTQKTGMAYGLPAVISCGVGSKLTGVKGSVCEHCYACTGRYCIPTVIACQAKRLESIKKFSGKGIDGDRPYACWVEAMVLLIASKNVRVTEENKGFFRWHDSGDIISVDHLCAIAQIARELPDIKFWLPTKEIRILNEWMKSNRIPSNLCIRLSATMVDKKAPDVRIPISHVHTKRPIGRSCPAIEVHSGCGKLGCRKCWDKRIKAISYKKH